jgi:hypothetical protein
MGTNMDTITLVIAALVTARVTRLITTDRITQAPRTWLLSRLNSEGLAAYLVVCDWCTSVYVGLGVGVVGLAVGLWSWPWIVPLGLAFSYVAGMLARGEAE